MAVDQKVSHDEIPVELAWDDLRYTFVATGRLPLAVQEQDALGELSSCFPLLR